MPLVRRRSGERRACPSWSSAAKRLVHDLFGPRRFGVAVENWLILIRPREHGQQVLEGREIPFAHGCDDRLLHQMVARDECRVCRAHRYLAVARLTTLLGKPLAPSRCPIVEGAPIA